MPPVKKRIIYLICFIVIIPIGLSTRKFGASMPGFIAQYGGDTLYTACIYFFLRIFLIQPPVWRVALYSLAISICVEILQLYHAPWIEKIRHTPPFGLILGYGFLWSDWLCYLVGAILGWLTGLLIEGHPGP